MNQFKNYLLLFSFLFIGLTSCQSDEDDPTVVANIEGKWQFAQEGEIVNNQEVLVDYEHTPGCTKDYTEFLANSVIKDHYYNGANC